jgi:lipopolysaccharide/colanic/teichoic acid biosynthesis glycosyltransferase
MLRPSLYHRFGKRLFDLLVTVPLLILLSPLMLIIGLCSLLFMGRPVFFRQVRPGFREQPFTIYKFRTMHDLKDSQGRLLPEGQRLNRFGTFLRRASLDELPQLWNVLRGDMSLVGPRPLLMRYCPYFTENERLRFLVRQGLTGLAQISGRDDLPWKNRMAMDVDYVKSYRLKLDLYILLITIGRVLSRSGAVANNCATMMDFDEERRLSRSQ